MDELESKKNFEQWLTDKIRFRIRERNLNALLGIYGPPGSGKSYTALRIAELIDPDFNVDKVTFDVAGLVHLVNSGLPVGTSIIGDDFGTAANSRKWQSDPNIVLSYVAQSFRFMRYATMITIPDITALDAQVRRLFHMSLQTLRKDEGHQAVICEPRIPYRYVARERVTFWKYPRPVSGGVLARVAFHMPSKELREAYEEKRKTFMKALYSDLEQSMFGSKARIPEWADNAVHEMHATGLTQSEIAKKIGVSQPVVHDILKRRAKRNLGPAGPEGSHA